MVQPRVHTEPSGPLPASSSMRHARRPGPKAMHVANSATHIGVHSPAGGGGGDSGTEQPGVHAKPSGPLPASSSLRHARRPGPKAIHAANSSVHPLLQSGGLEGDGLEGDDCVHPPLHVPPLSVTHTFCPPAPIWHVPRAKHWPLLVKELHSTYLLGSLQQLPVSSHDAQSLNSSLAQVHTPLGTGGGGGGAGGHPPWQPRPSLTAHLP